MQGESKDNDSADQVPAPSSTPPSPTASPARHQRRGYLIAATVVVIIVVAAVAGYALLGGFQKSSTSSKPFVIIPEGSEYSIPVGQFNGITFIVNATSVVNGTFENSFGIVLYQMTSAQFEAFVKTTILAGYEWTSGTIANGTPYDLDLTVTPGSWVLVFLNPNPYVTTAIGFFTDLTLAPA